MLKRHQDRIRAGLTDVNRRVAGHNEHHTGWRAFLHDSLRPPTEARRTYQHSGDKVTAGSRTKPSTPASTSPPTNHSAQH